MKVQTFAKRLTTCELILFFGSIAAGNLRAQTPGYFVSDYGFNGEFGIGVLNVDGSNVYNVLPNTQAGPPPGFNGGCNLDRTRTPRSPSMPLDGSVIVFESEGAPDRLHRAFIMNADGSGVTQVTSTDPMFPQAGDFSPAISPDGTRIALRSQRTADGSPQIFVVDPTIPGSAPTQVTFGGQVVGLAWSPDSMQLAYSGFNFPGFGCPFPNEGLKVINADGTGERFLACSRNGAAAAIDWSPDGLRIGFVDAYTLFGGPLGISQVAPDGTRLHDITPAELGHAGDFGGLNDTSAGSFRYSPDGMRLAYFAWNGPPTGGPQGISLINVDGTGKQDVINDHNYHHIWWQPGPAILPPTTLTLAPDPIVGGPNFTQQLSPVLKDSAGNILSRSASGYCTGDGRFAHSDQLGLVTFSRNPAPSTSMVVSNGGLVSNTITATPQTMDPPVSFYPATRDFGNQAVGIASATQTFTLTNTGTALLNVNSITLIGTNATDYAIDPSSTCPLAGGGPLMPADTCTILVAVAPLDVGTRMAQINIDDDAIGSPQGIPVTATGTAPATAVLAVNGARSRR